jgi:hypothetical protein
VLRGGATPNLARATETFGRVPISAVRLYPQVHLNDFQDVPGRKATKRGLRFGREAIEFPLL